MAGASAGAIIAALVAAGYTAAELREIIAFLSNSLKDRAWEDSAAAFPRTVSILKDRGMYEGEAFQAVDNRAARGEGRSDVRRLVRRPERPDAEELRYRYKLQVIASDLTEERLLVLPRDADRLGIENPDELAWPLPCA